MTVVGKISGRRRGARAAQQQAVLTSARLLHARYNEQVSTLLFSNADGAYRRQQSYRELRLAPRWHGRCLDHSFARSAPTLSAITGFLNVIDNVFEIERSGPFTPDAVNRLIKHIGERAGIAGSLPHAQACLRLRSGECRPQHAGAASSTRCATPSCRRRDSRTSGGSDGLALDFARAPIAQPDSSPKPRCPGQGLSPGR
jgi:hypothetical protein